MRGQWRAGKVRGHLVEKGWGAALGFPALILADDIAQVDVQMFESSDLPNHWQRLDAFEGNEYRRVAVKVETADGPFEAWIYVSAA